MNDFVHTAGTEKYYCDGLARAQAIGNRGPARFSTDGKLFPDILDAYWQYGFYVFEGVVAPAEIEELRRGVDNMVARAPVTPDAKVDAQGRPAFGLDFTRPTYSMSKPLQDPWGATNAYGGRHQVKMTQPTADADAPDYVVLLIHGMCQAMPAGLRVYGHPTMLAIAESINGEDFVPYNDSIIVKQPGLGASVAWHQDGVTHWDASDWDAGSHGVNFQFQLYPTTPGNCLWVVPGTHKLGRLDIKRLVAENSGDDRLPDAIPLICEAGDLTIVNRQMLHGSFANSSPDPRVSVTAGFHRRRAVLGQKAALGVADQDAYYDEQRIFERSAVIALAIDARQQYYPDESGFRYAPFAELMDEFRYSKETFDEVIRDYNAKDLAI